MKEKPVRGAVEQQRASEDSSPHTLNIRLTKTNTDAGPLGIVVVVVLFVVVLLSFTTTSLGRVRLRLRCTSAVLVALSVTMLLMVGYYMHDYQQENSVEKASPRKEETMKMK